MEYGVSDLMVCQMSSQLHAIAPSESEQWRVVFGAGAQTSSGARVTHKTAIGYPPFWRGVNLIANAVSGLPLDVYKRDGDSRDVASNHAVQYLIKQKANPVLRARKFRQTMQHHALIYGNGFAWIERDQRQRPIGLWPLNPQGMIVRYVDGDLWYATNIDGMDVRFPSREIVHVLGLSHNGTVGYSIVDVMAEALGVGMAAMQFGGRFFGQGANMSGILMVPGHFKEEKIANTIAAWEKMATGLTKSHRVALLQDGVKFQQMTIDPNKAQFLETRNFEVRSTVANILGIPPHLLGDDSRTSFNSLEAENQSFLTHSLNPWLHEWEDELSSKLLSDREQSRGTHFIEFNRDAAVQMSFRERIDGIYRQVEMGILSINEGRRIVNEPNIGPNGDKRYHPANWMEIGAVSSEQTAPAVQQTATAKTDTLAALLESSVTDAIEIEARRVVTAAKKEDNFCAWLNTFYNTWVERSVSGMGSAEARNIKREYANESIRQLLDVAGCSTTTTLAANVEHLVSSWDCRVETLISDLRGVA